MILSHTCEMAIRALAYIASQKSSQESLTVKEVSEAVSESSHTLAKALQLLVRHGYLSSTKGPAGGFSLSDKQLEISLYEIVIAIEGRNIFERCVLGLSNCADRHPCPMHSEFVNAKAIMERIFKENKISNLSVTFNSGKAYLN